MSEEFEKWNKSKNEYFYRGNSTRDLMLAAWQAARKIDAKRIAELENEVAAGTFACDLLNKVLAEICIALKGEPPYLTLFSYHDLPQLVVELESQNKVMREALEFYANGTPAKMTARGHYATDVRMEYDSGTAQNALESLKKEG